MSELIKCIRKSDGKEVFLPKKVAGNNKLMNEYGYYIAPKTTLEVPKIELKEDVKEEVKKDNLQDIIAKAKAKTTKK